MHIKDRAQLRTKRHPFRTWGYIVVALISLSVTAALGYGIFFVMKVTETADLVAHSSSTEARTTPLETLRTVTGSDDLDTLKGYSDGRINILLLGVAGTEKKGAYLTDTIMIASIDTTNHKVALLSLPRDLIVTHEKTNTKINALYSLGRSDRVDTAYIVDAVEDITGQAIHYDLVMNFQGFTEVIDALNGINVTVPRAIYDEQYPGPGYSFETFHIAEGLHTMNGDTALKYARTRYDDPKGDFGRAERQQIVLRSVRNKALSLGILTNPAAITDLLSAIGTNIATSFPLTHIKPALHLARKIDTQNVTTIVVDAWQPDSLLIAGRKGRIPGLLPRAGDWDDIIELSESIFTYDAYIAKKDSITREDANVHIIDTIGNARARRSIAAYLRTRGFSSVTESAQKATSPESGTVVTDHTGRTMPHSLNALLQATNGTRENTPTLDDTQEKTNNTRTEKNNYDFTITIGENLINDHLYEEATKEDVDAYRTELEQSLEDIS